MSDQPKFAGSAGGTPEGHGFMGSLKESMKKAGEAIDRGMAAVLKEAGQNMRATCPGCQKEVNAPPDELVECPMCHTHFRSPTVSARTAEISRTMKEDIKQAYKAQRGPTPAEPSVGPGETTTGAPGEKRIPSGTTATERQASSRGAEGQTMGGQQVPYRETGTPSVGGQEVPAHTIGGTPGGGLHAPTTQAPSVGGEQLPSRATETPPTAGEKLPTQVTEVPPRGAGA
jgi:hypothetical protein